MDYGSTAFSLEEEDGELSGRGLIKKAHGKEERWHGDCTKQQAQAGQAKNPTKARNARPRDDSQIGRAHV